MKKWWFWMFCYVGVVFGQERSLPYYIEQAKQQVPDFQVNTNLQKIGELQQQVITAQNKAFQVFATSDVWFTPYFNNQGKFIDVTANPDAKAYGYDIGITNGGLYSAQLNVTKNLFNKASVDRLLFQNEVQNRGLELSRAVMEHNLIKTITDAYIVAYQFQLSVAYTQQLVADLQLRLEVVAELVKAGILQQSDYALLELELQTRKLELQQLEMNLTSAIHQLDSSCGLPASTISELAAPELKLPEQEKAYFYERRFTNDSLQLEADQAVFENKYKPSVTLYGNTGLNAVSLNGIQRKIGLSAGIKLTIPIYDGKQRSFNSQQSQLKMENLAVQKKATLLQLQNQLLDLKQQQTTLQQSKELLQKQLEKQQQVLEIYKGKLVQGQVSVIDYLNVLQSYKMNVQTLWQLQTNDWLLQSQYQFINW